MEMKVCRICGKQNVKFIHIFKTEGLKNKIETCLPIIVTHDCPLPDTICLECLDTVDNFYSFIKNCLQNIIVLEAQYEIIESCLKTKRKVDRGVSVDPCDLVLPSLIKCEELTTSLLAKNDFTNTRLVDYEVSSCSDTEDEDCKKKDIPTKVNDIINEIVERKYNLKRKNNEETSNVPKKIAKSECGTDSSSRRKSSRPKRVEYHLESKHSDIIRNGFLREEKHELINKNLYFDNVYNEQQQNRVQTVPIPVPVPVPIIPQQQQQHQMQMCLLCEQQLPDLMALASHMFEIHEINLSHIYGSANTPTTTTLNLGQNIESGQQQTTQNKQKKAIPELVKISDVLSNKRINHNNNNKNHEQQLLQQQHQLLIIPEIKQETPTTLLDIIPKQQQQPVQQQQQQYYVCTECPPITTTEPGQHQQRSFLTFAEFSTHRRAQHQIFHCDLCPKFYGRNSHLWKHVNRVHKGHVAITCQECGKTSASEYHLSQHRNKMHSSMSQQQQHQQQHLKQRKQTQTKNVEKIKSAVDASKSKKLFDDVADSDDQLLNDVDDEDDLLNQKFQGFDFKSVRQSFLKQELLSKHQHQQQQRLVSVLKSNQNQNQNQNQEEKKKIKSEIVEPKEIDSTSDLYTTIITNYSPPTNEGPYKCPKCVKGFHKKNLLKKHKKNCRPRLQKDLLTRCKTCSRIFKDRQSLTKHLVNYHSEYTCEICHVAVQSKCEIVSHIRFTHPQSELECYCGQILRSKVDLARHKSDHRDSHVCQFCGDALPTKIKLKMHILSLHRKILALSCGICLRLFETQHVLRAHVQHAHADQLRPLTSCPVCGKNYGSKWKTYDHLNKSHGRIFRACKVCLNVFDNEAQLQQHFENAHVNNINNKPTVNNQQQQQPQQQQPPPQHVESDEDTPEMEQDDFDESNDDLSTSNVVMAFSSTPNIKQQQSPQNGVSKISLLEKRLLGNKKQQIIEEEQQPGTNDDIIQNSSKRTVYVNSNDPSLCEICLKVWPAKKHLWQHYIRCHKQTAATVCGICLKTNPSYGALQRHLRNTHPRLLHGCGFGSNFICKICGRYHNASSKLRLHMAIHVGYNDHIDEEHDEQDVEHEQEPEQEQDQDQEHDQDEDEEEEQEIKQETNKNETKTQEQQQIKQENEEDDEEEEDEMDSDEDEDQPELKQEYDQDINYESLIEEVEATDDDEDEEQNENEQNNAEEEEDDEQHAVPEEEENEDDQNEVFDEPDEEESTSDDNDETTRTTENDLEQEMLKNMIGESRSVKLTRIKLEPNVDEEFIEEPVSSRNVNENENEDDDEEEDELQDDIAAYEVELINDDDEILDNCIEFVKHEIVYSNGDEEDEEEEDEEEEEGTEKINNELDSAIRSICDENHLLDAGDGTAAATPAQEMYRRFVGRVNENELETAVGSIL